MLHGAYIYLSRRAASRAHALAANEHLTLSHGVHERARTIGRRTRGSSNDALGGGRVCMCGVCANAKLPAVGSTGTRGGGDLIVCIRVFVCVCGIAGCAK